VLHFIVGGRTTEIEAEMRRFDQLLLLGVLGLVLVMGGATALQVRVGLRPLRGLLADLEAVWQGRRHRVDEALPRELAPLAAAVNQLLDHDDRALVRARDQAADLAHAIKTPLAVLRTDLDRLDPTWPPACASAWT
jgi:signal transduction histidine kinase